MTRTESKKIKRSVSLEPEQLAAAQAEADVFHGGNISRYIASLIAADLEGSDLRGAEALVQFSSICRGNYTDRLKRAASDKQPFAEIVENLTGNDPKLMALAKRAYDFLRSDADQHQSEWKALSNDRIILAATTLARLLNERGASALVNARHDLPLAGESPPDPYLGVIKSGVGALQHEAKQVEAGERAKAGTPPP